MELYIVYYISKLSIRRPKRKSVTRAQPGKVTPGAVATVCTTTADVNLPGPGLSPGNLR